MSEPAQRVLIVEDEPKILALLDEYLRASGYETECLSDGNDAVRTVREHAPDIVLLDVMLPGKSGLDICRDLRGFSQVPIIMITARVEELDRLLGLGLGADDYICKPFSPREVVARVQAVLRRVRAATGHTTDSDAAANEYGGVVLDQEAMRARVDGEALDLTPVEFRLLHLLLGKPGRVFARNQIMDAVYTDGRVVSDRTMDTHVKNLRRKLAPFLQGRELIHSVYGVGYRLE